jgi:hypothetical protein
MYEIELDWRPLNIQAGEYSALKVKDAKPKPSSPRKASTEVPALETVLETDEGDEGSGEKSRQSVDGAPKETVNGSLIQQRSSSVPEEWTDAVRPEQDGSPPELIPETTKDQDQDGMSGSNAVGSVGDDTSFSAVPPDQLGFRVRARIRAIDVSNFAPPVLPKLEKGQVPQGSLFTFWTADTAKKKTYKEGDHCTTPYGPGVIEARRDKEGIVVVSLSGWKARAYLQEADVKVESRGLLHTLRRQFAAGETTLTQKPLEFPYAAGTKINTPFGEGSVKRPLPQHKPTRSKTLKSDQSKPTKIDMAVTQSVKANVTIGISLTSWTLADKTHPMLYCTEESARDWKDNRKKASGDGLLSALGTLIPTSFLSRPPKTKVTRKESPSPKFKQYYRDGAAVTTMFGNGVVCRFRPYDGFYEVSLRDWTLADGKHAMAVLRKNDISHRIAKGCHEGYPVLTSLGVSGSLASVEPTTGKYLDVIVMVCSTNPHTTFRPLRSCAGVHIVTVPSAGMVCYLQPDHVIRPLKAAVGENVLTAYGDGKVVRYRQSDDFYVINLKGWGATLYAKAETFDRDVDNMNDKPGSFGMTWLFGLLFSSSGRAGSGQRSRSNSVASVASNWSQNQKTGRSLVT